MAAPLPFPTDHPDPPREPKSVGLAVLLAALFGPLGLFYVSTGGALFMLFLLIVLGLFTVGLGLIPVWLLCIAWAYAAAVHSRNATERPCGGSIGGPRRIRRGEACLARRRWCRRWMLAAAPQPVAGE